MKQTNLRILGTVCVLILTAWLASATVGWPLRAAPVAEQDAPRNDMSIGAMVGSKITYQGMLSEAGEPVTGARDMVFRLYSDDSCTTQEGSDIVHDGVTITDGLFSVDLLVSAHHFNGQALWIQVEIGGERLGCVELVPVPYALSLRPGARIGGSVQDGDGIRVVNTATTGDSIGVFGQTHSVMGRAVAGYNMATSGDGSGVYGRSESARGAGVIARGVDSGADLILAGNDDTTVGDNGVIKSDPAYASSDIVIASNDTVRIELDRDGDGEDADFEIRNKDDVLIFDVDERGHVAFGGPGLSVFPRPAYDSGLVSMSQNENRTLTHNLGGNADNYVVDLTCQHASYGRHAFGVGGDVGAEDFFGVFWRNLTTSTINVERAQDDGECPSIRIRIWIYP